MDQDNKPHRLFVVPQRPGSSLEERTAAALLWRLRETESRKALREHLGVGDAAIEAALLSGKVRKEIQQAIAAFWIEQAPELLLDLVAGAKKDPKSPAWKFFFHPAALAEFVRSLGSSSSPEEDVPGFSEEFEQDFQNSIREIEEGGRIAKEHSNQADS